MHRYSDGKILATDGNFKRNIRKRYDDPFVDMHRVDLQELLYTRDVELEVATRLDKCIASVDHKMAKIELE